LQSSSSDALATPGKVLFVFSERKSFI